MRNLLVVSAVALVGASCSLPPVSERAMARAFYPPTRAGAECDSVRARNLTIEQLRQTPQAARPRLMEPATLTRTLPLEDPSLQWLDRSAPGRVQALPPVRGRARVSVLVDYAGFPDPRSIQVSGVTDLAFAKDVEHWVLQSRFYPGVAEGCAINWPEPIIITAGP